MPFSRTCPSVCVHAEGGVQARVSFHLEALCLLWCSSIPEPVDLLKSSVYFFSRALSVSGILKSHSCTVSYSVCQGGQMTSLRMAWCVHKSRCPPVQLLSVSTPCVEQTISKTPRPTRAPASSIDKVSFIACVEPNVAAKIGQPSPQPWLTTSSHLGV